MVAANTTSSGTAQAPALASVLAGLLATDPAAMDRDALAGLVKRSQRVRGWLDAFDARIAIRAADLAAQGACESAGSVLGDRGRRSQRDAEAAANRGGVCKEMPSIQDALADGTISSGHVDAIANTAAQLDDTAKAELVELEKNLVNTAAAMPVAEFERECQNLGRILAGDDGTSRHERHRKARRVKRWVDRQTGMCKTLIELDAETDGKMWTAINAAIAAARANKQDAELTFDQLQADAVVNLITGARGTDQRVPEISVLIDYQTLRNGLHDRSTCETSDGNPLPVETIRRLCCDGEILPIVLGTMGEVLDVGRSERLANRQQRRALRAMYRTCAHPDCTVKFDRCRIHHVIPWETGGPTNLDHLIPLCDRHHHDVHEGGWTLTLRPDRTITLRRPDGTVSYTGTTVNRTTPTNTPAPTAGIDPEPVQTPAPPEPVTADKVQDEPVGVPEWIFTLFEHRQEHSTRTETDQVAIRTLQPGAPTGRPPP